MINIVATTPAHWVKAKPRKIESAEAPYRDSSIQRCPSLTMLDMDGRVVAITGAYPIKLLDAEYYTWLYGTDLIYRHPKTFFKACRIVLHSFPLPVWAWINEKHQQAVAMAEKLGFEPTTTGKHIDNTLSYKAYIWHP